MALPFGDHRITLTDFRLCSTCQSCSQAGLCQYTLNLISDQIEPTVARLRYNLGGDRPVKLPTMQGPETGLLSRLDIRNNKAGISHFDSTRASAQVSKSPSYATHGTSNATAKL